MLESKYNGRHVSDMRKNTKRNQIHKLLFHCTIKDKQGNRISVTFLCGTGKIPGQV